MKKYAIYLRKSRADVEAEAKGELETLRRHEAILTSYAKEKKMIVETIYKEIVSGESIQARPEMLKLLSEVSDGKYEGVLVMEIERLARGDAIDQGIIASTFKESNTKIITPTKIYDPSNEFDEEYFEFSLFMSRREYKTINRRIQMGRVSSAKEGKAIVSTPPYGYDKVKIENDKGYTFKPNKEADVVKLIFELYNQGKGSSVIAKHLDQMGIKPRKSSAWSKATILDILKNPVYIGKIRWGFKEEKTVRENGYTKTSRKKRDDYIYVDGIHPAIISEEDFNTAQRIRVDNRTRASSPSTSLKNPLSGIVYCKKCNSLMTRLGSNSRNRHPSLFCPNRYCNNVAAPIFLIEGAIIRAITQWVGDFEIKIQQSPVKTSTRVEEKLLAALKKDVAIIEKQIVQTYDLLEQGIYSYDIFAERNQNLSERKLLLEKSIKEVVKKIKKENYIRDAANDFVPMVRRLADIYPHIPTALDKNKILKEILFKVEYSKEKANTRGQLLNENFEIDVYPLITYDP